MKILLGKSYANQKGYKVTIIRCISNTSYPFISLDGERYSEGGDSFGELSPDNIISEWIEPVKFPIGHLFSYLGCPMIAVCITPATEADPITWLTAEYVDRAGVIRQHQFDMAVIEKLVE